MATTRTTKSSTTRRAATPKRVEGKPVARASTATNGASKKAPVKTPVKASAATTPASASSSATVQMESIIEPVQALNALALENAGKLVDLQLGALRRYSEAVLDGCREVSSLEDAEALQAFVAHQSETLRSLTTAAAEDFQAASRIGMDYAKTAGDIIGRSVNKAT